MVITPSSYLGYDSSILSEGSKMIKFIRYLVAVPTAMVIGIGYGILVASSKANAKEQEKRKSP
jgi:hypothetical protein